MLLASIFSDVFAHAGHIGDLAGHDHWVLGIGLGVIAGAAVVGWLKGDRDEAEDDEAEDIEDAEERPA